MTFNEGLCERGPIMTPAKRMGSRRRRWKRKKRKRRRDGEKG